MMEILTVQKKKKYKNKKTKIQKYKNYFFFYLGKL